MSTLLKYLPMASWLPLYDRRWLQIDLLAGLGLWAITVPQALAYADIAGVPAVYGLYTIPLAMIAYAIFGTSRTLSVGPDASTAILSAVIISTVAVEGSAEYIAVTAALALLVGIMFLISGLFRMGWVTNFLATPVQRGFIHGIAVVVIIDQIPRLLGIDVSEEGFFQQLWSFTQSLPDTDLATIVVGIGSLALLYVLRKFASRTPAALITIVVAIIVSTLLNLSDAGVAVVGFFETGLPHLGIPNVDLGFIPELILGALAIILVGYTESIGGAKAAAERTGEKIDPDQELIALGMANVGSGLSSGFVVAGSLLRTTVIRSANGRTQIIGLVNAGLVILTLLFLLPFFQNLPLATLAAIVIGSMIGVFDIDYFRKLRAFSLPEFWFAIIALLGEVIFGVLEGVLLVVILSLLLLIRRASHPETAVVGKIPGSGKYRDSKLHSEAKKYPGLIIFRMDDSLRFSNANYFDSQIKQAVSDEDTPVRCVLVDGETINDIDSTAIEMLARLNKELDRKSIKLAFAELKDPVMQKMRRAGLDDKIGHENFYETLDDAVGAFQNASQ